MSSAPPDPRGPTPTGRPPTMGPKSVSRTSAARPRLVGQVGMTGRALRGVETSQQRLLMTPPCKPAGSHSQPGWCCSTPLHSGGSAHSGWVIPTISPVGISLPDIGGPPRAKGSQREDRSPTPAGRYPSLAPPLRSASHRRSDFAAPAGRTHHEPHMAQRPLHPRRRGRLDDPAPAGHRRRRRPLCPMRDAREPTPLDNRLASGGGAPSPHTHAASSASAHHRHTSSPRGLSAAE